jgi:osmotically-inducible protein OsmY
MEDQQMKPDSELKRDVEAELSWSPDVDQTDLAVKVHNAVVTLTGFVPSFFEKHRAEEAVKRVAGVAAIANDVQVRPLYGSDDPQIARAAVAAIRAELPSAPESVKALVQNGHVTLEGSVEWNFQRERVEDVVRRLTGVITVDNEIMIKPRVSPGDIKRMIEDAFRRSAEVDASHISVQADGGTVTLTGRVRTWSERTQAQQTAWFAPGVNRVNNEITIST